MPALPDAEPLPMDEPEDALPLMPEEPLAPAEPLLPLIPELPLPLAPAEPPADPLVEGEDDDDPLLDGKEVDAEPDPEAEPDAAVFSFGCPVA